MQQKTGLLDGFLTTIMSIHKRGNINIALTIALATAIISTGVTILLFIAQYSIPRVIPPSAVPPGTVQPPGTPSLKDKLGLEKFTSEEEFQAYIQESLAMKNYGYGGGMLRNVAIETMMFTAPMALDVAASAQTETPSRISQTNVQVQGIDEPDIVKTDGNEIYFSSQSYGYYPSPLRGISFVENSIIYPPQPKRGIKSIKAFPPADLKLDSTIDGTGNLLLYDNTLIVLANNQIIGYDVSDPANPTEKWKKELDNRNWIQETRLFNGKIYLITAQSLSYSHPCPIPLFVGDGALSIPCIEIYHPKNPISAETTYTALILNPKTGDVEKDISFVGSLNNTTIYMSQSALYLTYALEIDTVSLLFNFFSENGEGLVGDSFISRLGKLQSYDISNAAKMTELSVIFQQLENSFDDDERLLFENEFENRMSDYFKKRVREFEQTEIVKIGLTDLTLQGSGKIPGRLLNQFSLDEYKNHLRIATTVGDGFFSFGFGGSRGESMNDVYVLNNNLEVVGAIRDLGLTERIYSARFIGDKGYLVTFRQIDPFYVLDLSSPTSPKMTGELKIPGYSSYLHPINNERILGIGKEGSQVKASLFDVSDPKNPTEASKYILSEYWSDVLNTHHAFLLDDKYNIFFLPGNKGGYIFSYENDTLQLKKAVSNIRAKRALFLDDYLYIIGEDKIVVLNETDWLEVNKLEF